MLASLTSFLTFVGFYAFSCYLYDNLRTPCLILLRRLQQIKGDAIAAQTLRQRFGDWAAITGSSDGIGKAYAKELARRGLNVILIARNETKLKAVAEEIENEFNVETKIIIADFTQGSKIYEHIERELNDLPVGILINNVGTAVSKPNRAFLSSHEELQAIIDTNVVAVTQLSRYFLHRMYRQKTKGAIVNVSSGTELEPVPFAALYAATKAFTRSLTLALAEEARPFGITVQLLSPNFVVTKINSYSKVIMRGGLFVPDAETYARSAVALLDDEVEESTGYFWHAIQTGAFKLFPMRVRLNIVQTFFGIIVDKKTSK